MNEYKFSDIKLGMGGGLCINLTQEMVDSFCKITGDINPLHTDTEFAKSKGFQEKVIYGMLISSFLSTLAGVYLPGRNSLIHEVNILFKKPVFLSDSPLIIKGNVIELNEMFKQFTMKFEIRNNKNEKVCRGIMKVGVLDD